MNTGFTSLLRLFFTFISSFSIAFTGICLTLSDQSGVELDWSILTNKAVDISDAVSVKTASAFERMMVLAEFYADADAHVEKTLIYSAPRSSEKLIQTDSSAELKKYTRSTEGILLQGNIKDFVYYSQHDARWSDYLYGSSDPMDRYGCGPTALAMIVANLSKEEMTPVGAAQWASQHGHYAAQSGSYHGILVDGAHAFGLDSAAFTDYSPEAVRSELEKGNIFGALMKPGLFSSSSGHFILILGLDENGKVIVADSNSLENTTIRWDLQTLLNELKYGSSNGGPLWIVRLV